MCGIAGVYLRKHAVDSELLDGLGQSLGHRGPDKLKTYAIGNLGLVHTRLSIIDLAGGDQPLFNSSGNLALVANGEIYNHIEIRTELESLGAVFTTHSDCEVILHAYAHYGERFLDKLNGMFAFALYDQVRGRLILARDRLGIKPLFFTETRDGFYFASEQKALLPMLPGGVQVDPDALIQILETNFNTGHTGLTLGMSRVLPGEMMILENGHIATRKRYWTLDNLDTASVSYHDAAAEFESLMPQIMEEHMRSDVPLAILLSGGVDSSIVLEWLNRSGARELQAFTAAFTDTEYNSDLAAAKAIANQFGLRHTVVELDRQSLFNHLPFAVWAADDLIADDAILPTSLLARKVSEQFKVVFSGEGGDELFAGYGRYRRLKIQRVWANLLRPGSGGFRTRGHLRAYWRKNLLTGELQQHLSAGRRGFIEAWQSTPSQWTDLRRMLCTDMATELPDQLLVKVDRMLMAWGLEGRVPLLDHRLVEFAITLPDALKLRGREGKHFLKRWGEPIFGNDLMRRPKSGFSVPMDKCLTGETLRKLFKVLPTHPAFNGLFMEEGIKSMIQRQEAKGDCGQTLSSLLQLAIWHRIFVVGKGAKPELFLDPLEFIA